ncbi:unnamed protein product [Clonostachys rhizophaga]|uniref:Major facilitator superfamily (MFS) profile domain-containing protein n=1 Tax=Clonostachys rhizophaga TaxID=160324 RepID=A0A9N9VA25_9HYPO|nr:unnamed protein product [Clonostachys rhizophaga]
MIVQDHQIPASASADATLKKGEQVTDTMLVNGSDGHAESLTSADRQRTIVGFRWIVICIAIFSANLLYGLDTTIAADIQGAISETFNNVTQLGWLGVGFNLGSTVAILPVGKAYGIFDTKWLYIICLIMFAAGSALCGGAPNMNAMIVGRIWAGVGGAGMYLGTLNLVTTLCAPSEVSVYVGLIGFVYGGGCILGPIVGGLLADSAASWRWAFYLNLVIFGAMAPVYFFMLPSVPRQVDRTFNQKIFSLDWAGTVLSAAMYTCFVLAFAFGGVAWAWNDPRVISLITLSALFLVAFGTSQRLALFTNLADRLFPCDFLGDLQLVLLYVCMACGGAALFVSIYYIPLYYLFVHGDTGLEAAIRLLPFICVYVAAVLMAGYAIPKTGYHMIWYLVSGIFLTAGGAAMLTVSPKTPDAHVYAFSVLIALGLTVCQASYSIAAQLVKPGREPESIQFLNISQGQSQLLGLAIASSVFQSIAFNGMKTVLDGMGFSDAEIQTAIAGAKSALLERVDDEVRQRCTEVIVQAVRYEWVLVIVAGILQTICSCFLTRKRSTAGQFKEAAN